jgi:hypothetical protein
MAKAYSWTCPYCNQNATITDNNLEHEVFFWNSGNKDGKLCVEIDMVVCPNDRCRQYVITSGIYKTKTTAAGTFPDKEALESWKLRPKSSSKPFPDYIPKPILDDYKEACLIVADSPKASATLSRRCLQGIIRDFWKISKPRLIDEIKELEGKIDAITWQAIDSVRNVGNIGAHMEKDINVIIDVGPEEAGLLIGLVEYLLKECYVAQHEREEHMQKVINLAKVKAEAKSNGLASN